MQFISYYTMIAYYYVVRFIGVPLGFEKKLSSNLKMMAGMTTDLDKLELFYIQDL